MASTTTKEAAQADQRPAIAADPKQTRKALAGLEGLAGSGVSVIYAVITPSNKPFRD